MHPLKKYGYSLIFPSVKQPTISIQNSVFNELVLNHKWLKVMQRETSTSAVCCDSAITSFSECRSTSPAHCMERKKALNFSFICSTRCFRGLSQRSLACDTEEKKSPNIHIITAQCRSVTQQMINWTIPVKPGNHSPQICSVGRHSGRCSFLPALSPFV